MSSGGETETRARGGRGVPTAAKLKSWTPPVTPIIPKCYGQAVECNTIYGQCYARGSVARVSPVRWLSRSDMKFQIKAPFKLLNRALCQLSWSYCSTQPSNTRKHNYSSSWHMSTISDAELERLIIGSRNKKAYDLKQTHKLEPRCNFFSWLLSRFVISGDISIVCSTIKFTKAPSGRHIRAG